MIENTIRYWQFYKWDLFQKSLPLNNIISVIELISSELKIRNILAPTDDQIKEII